MFRNFRAVTVCAPAVAIAWALFLFSGSNNVFPQQKAKRPNRASSSKVAFASGHSALNIPFKFEFNQIVLQVRVNDSAPLKFLFDTGAGASVLSARRAAALSLKEGDSVRATGVGGDVAGSMARGVSLAVPGVTVRNQRIVLLPLDFPFCEARDIEGIIGYDFIKEFVVEINYDARIISLFDPAGYKSRSRADVLPLVIDGTPRVRMSIALPGRPAVAGLFEIDTGSDGALTINSPFVKRHGLIKALSAQIPNNERGLGGESKRVDARLSQMQIGRIRIGAPLVGFSLDEKGAMAEEDNDGPLGNEVLKRFKVTIDYSRKQMMLAPNSHLTDPFESDMSGITIDAEGRDCRTFKVSEVTEKSPAAEAGIMAGDEIVAIDGKRADLFSSARIERLLQQDGAKRSLTMRRGGRLRVVSLMLRRRI
jgi:hypothetical protein